MVGPGIFNGVFEGILIAGIMIALSLWAGWEIIDLIFIDDSIKSTELIRPEIKIVVNNNEIDTLYIYRQP